MNNAWIGLYNSRLIIMLCDNSTSSTDMSELSTNNIISNNEQDIPTMRVPTQPVYVTTNNQQQQPISLRQRSRSEDMISSRDLSIGQTTNLDDDNNDYNDDNFWLSISTAFCESFPSRQTTLAIEDSDLNWKNP